MCGIYGIFPNETHSAGLPHLSGLTSVVRHDYNDRRLPDRYAQQMNNLISTIKYIVSRSVGLRDKFTDASLAPVEFACIFCQNEDEYNKFTNEIEKFGKIVEKTPSGFTHLLGKPIETAAGPLLLVKIRKPDIKRPERGDADFSTDYTKLKKKYQNNSNFELVKRDTFEMLRLSYRNFDVMACFSNIPKSKDLGIKL